MILAIETATDVCGAAIVHAGRIVGERSVAEKKVHSERLLPMIDELLRECSVPLEDVEAIAVSIGPGSFTGLRIGLSTAKGLAVARGTSLIPVPTLDALAFEYVRRGGMHQGECLCPLIDAKRDEAYFSFYRAEGLGVTRCAPYEIAGVSKIAEAAASFGDVVALGDAAEKMERAGTPNGRFRVVRNVLCSAASVGLTAEAGAKRLAAGEFRMLEPMYIRDFIATQPGQKNSRTVQRVPVELPKPIHSSKD